MPKQAPEDAPATIQHGKTPDYAKTGALSPGSAGRDSGPREPATKNDECDMSPPKGPSSSKSY